MRASVVLILREGYHPSTYTDWDKIDYGRAEVITMKTIYFRCLAKLMINEAPETLREELQSFLDIVENKTLNPKLEKETFPVVVTAELQDWFKSIGIHLPEHDVSEN